VTYYGFTFVIYDAITLEQVAKFTVEKNSDYAYISAVYLSFKAEIL